MEKYDVIILGAGRSTIIADRLAKAGKKVALVESETLGGTCPNRGCVPSKLLIGYSDLIYHIKEAKRFGIDLTVNDISLEEIFKNNKDWTDNVDARYESRLTDLVDIYRGEGSFVSNDVIKVQDKELSADKIVIAQDLVLESFQKPY